MKRRTLGLAAITVAVGIIVATSRRDADRLDRLDRLKVEIHETHMERERCYGDPALRDSEYADSLREKMRSLSAEAVRLTAWR